MDNLFNNEQMKKTMKKAQRRATWKTIFITFCVLIVTLPTGKIANDAITRFLQSHAQNSVYTLHQVEGANEFIGTTRFYPGILGGEIQYKTFKYIEGKIVPTGDDTFDYGFLRDEVLYEGSISPFPFGTSNSDQDLDVQRYNELGQREMLFFYPFINYKKTRNDLALLPQIGDDKIMEIAISFDKGYTMQEALAKLPKNVTATWLWVKDVDEIADHTDKLIKNEKVEESNNLLRSEHDVYGFSLLNANGDVAENPADQFVRAISTGTRQTSSLQDEYKRLEKEIGGADGLSVNDLVIYGAVVTGNKKTLTSLQNLDFIKASSIGVITDKY
ncbi:anti sigma factor C-terminal domain-containing protein [Lysinibacillus sp. fls2-241-R2A-57]|uniref:anti sigma factor C-terminal domain-containing protein n=1 Tax=Lysinibacillus sp. fls2-241-R2A-57 TaxID=3040292 RepID=UPI002554437D|nr:anti sigma factor C-terminal domain-containing protein [Lysinibacillus sp. fls2-241-R2A-57]